MSTKWLTDKVRNRARRVSRAVLDQHEAGEPFAFDALDGLGPRVIETREEIETLLGGLAVPLMHPQVATIRRVMRHASGPKTADEITARVVRLRPEWNPPSVKRRVWDAQLRVVDRAGVSAKGRACARYSL